MKHDEFDDVDKEFMRDYGVSPEQMRFFKAAYRREVRFKVVIGVLALVLVTAAVYLCVR